VEKALSCFEGEVATALRKLEDTPSFDGQNRHSILDLMALLAARSPERREQYGRQLEAEIKMIMGLSLATKDRWESQTEQMKRDGIDLDETITYDDIKEFHESKKYTIEVSREHHISTEFVAIEAIRRCLYARNWLLIKSTHESGPFITSDNPVVLTWNEPDKIPLLYRSSPGYGCRGTQVYFPISRRVAILGEFDGREGLIEGNRQLVAALNTKTLLFRNRQIYSPGIGFFLIGKAGYIVDGKQTLKQFNA
jgi:hypothetical protein